MLFPQRITGGGHLRTRPPSCDYLELFSKSCHHNTESPIIIFKNKEGTSGLLGLKLGISLKEEPERYCTRAMHIVQRAAATMHARGNACQARDVPITTPVSEPSPELEPSPSPSVQFPE
jgi:hypothetical protein